MTESDQPQAMYVAMLDILGYSAGIEDDTFLPRLQDALQSLSINEAELHIAAFSDTIVVSALQGQLQHMLEALTEIFLSFLRRQILVRGGLTYGRHYRKGMLTYSPALVVAHRLESQIAIVPRIVVDDEVHTISGIYGEVLEPPLDGQLAVEDGIRFLHVARSDVAAECVELAQYLFEESRPQLEADPRALFKHRWLQDYLLQSLAVTGDERVPYVPGILLP